MRRVMKREGAAIEDRPARGRGRAGGWGALTPPPPAVGPASGLTILWGEGGGAYIRERDDFRGRVRVDPYLLSRRRAAGSTRPACRISHLFTVKDAGGYAGFTTVALPRVSRAKFGGARECARGYECMCLVGRVGAARAIRDDGVLETDS